MPHFRRCVSFFNEYKTSQTSSGRVASHPFWGLWFPPSKFMIDNDLIHLLSQIPIPFVENFHGNSLLKIPNSWFSMYVVFLPGGCKPQPFHLWHLKHSKIWTSLLIRQDLKQYNCMRAHILQCIKKNSDSDGTVALQLVVNLAQERYKSHPLFPKGAWSWTQLGRLPLEFWEMNWF